MPEYPKLGRKSDGEPIPSKLGEKLRGVKGMTSDADLARNYGLGKKVKQPTKITQGPRGA